MLMRRLSDHVGMCSRSDLKWHFFDVVVSILSRASSGCIDAGLRVPEMLAPLPYMHDCPRCHSLLGRYALVFVLLGLA